MAFITHKTCYWHCGDGGKKVSISLIAEVLDYLPREVEWTTWLRLILPQLETTDAKTCWLSTMIF